MIEELLVLAALIVLAVLVWRPVRRTILGTLDGRAERIRGELDEAQRLHEEAKGLLAKYERQLGQGQELAEEIAAEGSEERKRLEAKLKAELEASMKRRTELAMERIAQEEAQAVAEVRARAADLAIRTTRRVLTERLGDDQAQTLIRNAIQEVGDKLA